MQYTVGDSHFVDPATIARSIEAFNEQIRETGYINDADEYVSKEMDYIEDVQNGDYNSDYKRIQIANAIERINAKISHMKPSIDGRIVAPEEEGHGMTIDGSPSGSDSYREYYIREMAKRVNREEDECYTNTDAAYEDSTHVRRSHERSIRRRHRPSNRQ